MKDPVYHAFLQTAAEDAAEINRQSDVVRLFSHPLDGEPPFAYRGVLREVEHLERTGEGVRAITAPILFRVYFPERYCRAFDGRLQFEVIALATPVFHPNVRGGRVCLGPAFRGGTRLRALMEQFYRIASARVFAPAHAFDADAQNYYLDHVDDITRLRAPPLWRRPVATRTTVRSLDETHAPSEGVQP